MYFIIDWWQYSLANKEGVIYLLGNINTAWLWFQFNTKQVKAEKNVRRETVSKEGFDDAKLAGKTDHRQWGTMWNLYLAVFWYNWIIWPLVQTF